MYLLIPMLLAILLVYFEKIGHIELRKMAEIDLSTLLFVFPIILALTERFNQLFVVKRKDQNAAIEVQEEAHKTNFKRSVFASFTVGILLAIAGFRILETFIVPPDITTGQLYENTLFRSLDCILTGAVIAGGTEGWHQLVALLSDLTKAKRTALKKTGTL